MWMMLYGVNEIIKLTTIKFPASVCLMLANFAFLCLCSQFLGKSKTGKIIKVIDIPAGFSLKWINIFFTPSFVTLPLADKISVQEAFIIAAVFVFGYLIMAAFMAYVVLGLQHLLGTHKRTFMEELEDEVPSNDPTEPNDSTTSNDSTTDNDSTTGTATVELTQMNLPPKSLQIPSRTGPQPNHSRKSSSSSETEVLHERAMFSQYVAELPGKSKSIAKFITDYIDWGVYILLLIAGIPVYYAASYALPLHLAIGVLLFRAALLIPARWKRFFHPILVSFAFSLLMIYIFAVIKHDGFLSTLESYKTGRTYLYLFNHDGTDRWPGAGDVLSSLMDIAIVSLSLAMFNYRSDLKRYFFTLMPPVLVCSFASFFIYPPLCYHIGISPQRSLGFVGRSVTLALGTPLVEALGGSVPLMAVTTIVSGILGVLSGDFMFGPKFLRIKKDDFVTRGVTLGVNCGAVSTAHLLTVDPRAAAMSTLSFVLFGTVMVILSAITPIVKIVQEWVSL